MPLILVALSIAVASPAWAGGKSVHGLSFRPQPVPKVGCEAFDIRQDADPFFKNLKERKHQGEVEYWRNRNVVANYPDSTVLAVTYWSQTAFRFVSCTALPAFDPARIKFRIEWEDHGRRTSADGTFVFSQYAEPRRWCEGKCAEFWKYELRIDSRNVPLANNLIIRIETEEGVRLAEYIGKLSAEEITIPPPIFVAGQLTQ